MKITSFSVSMYRSIKETEKINLANLTVLVGPNNEGKSNILKAFILGSDLLMTYSKEIRRTTVRGRRRLYLKGEVESYKWEEDFPLELQDKKPEGKTTLTFEFELNKEETDEFVKETGIRLNGKLPITLTINNKEKVEFDVLLGLKARADARPLTS